jgi:TP901 family phage tail tape measure protein
MALVGKLDILLVTKTAQMEKGLKRGSTLTDQFSRNLTKTARQLIGFGSAAAGIYAVSRALQAVVKESDDFNRSMAQSLAILDKVNANQRMQMRLTAQTASFGTRFSPADAAKGYFYLESAGMGPEQAEAALPQAMEFAIAGGGAFDLATAVDLLTDAQSALGLTSQDTAENLKNLKYVSDQLVGANTLANASVQQFSEALTNKAAAAARQVGMNMSETLAVLAAFADQGIKGAEGGTAFSIVLRDLQTKAILNKQAFKDAGVAVYDVNGEFRKAWEIVGDLEKRLAGASDEVKKHTLLTMGFSDKSVGYQLALLGMSEKIKEYNRQQEEMNDKTKKVAANMDTAWGRLTKRVKSTLGMISRNTVGAAVERLSAQFNQQSELAAKLIVTPFRILFREIKEGFFGVAEPLETIADKAGTAAAEVDNLGESIAEALAGADLDKIADALHLTPDVTAGWKELDTRLDRMGRTLGLDQFDVLRGDARALGRDGLDPISLGMMLAEIDDLQKRTQLNDVSRRMTSLSDWDIQQAKGERFNALDQFAQQFETPIERFDRLTDDLAMQLSMGQDPEIIRRALLEGIKNRDAAIGTGEQPKGAAALTQGTQAAFAAEQQKRTQDTAKEHLEVSKEANGILERMTTGLENAGFTPSRIGE